jgi:hypothetical protein
MKQAGRQSKTVAARKRPGAGRPGACDPERAMKILLGILAVLAVAASFYADFKWRRWLANRSKDKDLSVGAPPARRHRK